MDILHVAQPSDGGVARYLLAACADQARRGWNVTVAGPDIGGLPAELAAAGVAHVVWPARRNPGASTVHEAVHLRAIVDRRRPQVVHLHAAKAGLAGRLPLQRRIPTLFQPHGWSWLAVDGALRRATLTWERAAARWTDLLVCVGTDEAREGWNAGVRGRYTIVRNGVDLDRFRPQDARDRNRAKALLGLDPQRPLALCPGRITRQKGQDVLLAAWPTVQRHCPDASLAIVGAGDLQAALPLLPGVRFAGPVDDIRRWLAAADVVVLPSRWEGLSLTALEALASGRAVVASAVPGLTEVVGPAVGALVPPEQPTALAHALVERLGGPRLLRAESRAAAAHALRFDARRTFDQLAAATLSVATPSAATGVHAVHAHEAASWRR